MPRKEDAVNRRTILAVAALIVSVAFADTRAADVSGRWTASFTTEIGEQQYTYEFVVKGTTLTGTAKGSLTGQSPIVEGKVDGDTITFVENASFMEMPLRITYKGKMTSADEIQFERNVADIATEKLVAKRAK
jgi:hypothetical protein